MRKSLTKDHRVLHHAHGLLHWRSLTLDKSIRRASVCLRKKAKTLESDGCHALNRDFSRTAGKFSPPHLVVTKGAELAGIVSERDLGGPKLPKSLGEWTVADLMTTPVVTVTTRTPGRRAAALMTR